MSNTEKLIKKLMKQRVRKLKEHLQTKENNSVVRVQLFKKALITLATDLLANKKLKLHYLKICYH